MHAVQETEQKTRAWNFGGFTNEDSSFVVQHCKKQRGQIPPG